MIPRRCAILDIDGVIRQGRELLPGAAAAVDAIRAGGLRVGFLTNNSMHGPDALNRELERLGVRLEAGELMTSARAAALWLARERPGASVHVCGTEDLEEELRRQGVRVGGPDGCDVVLVGMDPEVHYRDLADALDPLLRGALFVVCNRDPSYPIEGGRLMPGCGAVVSALEAASQRRADVEIGKPSPIAMEELCAALRVEPTTCIVVGDTISSDIEMARRVGVPALWIAQPGTTDAPEVSATLRASSLSAAVPLLLELAESDAPSASG